LVQAKTGQDYCRSESYVFDGRGDAFKISTLEGQCLVHNKGGKAVITQALTQAHVQALRQGRQQLAQVAKEKSKPQVATGESR